MPTLVSHSSSAPMVGIPAHLCYSYPPLCPGVGCPSALCPGDRPRENLEALKMLTIRLRRMGARNNPFYRVVVSDSRNTPTAAAVEEIGHYDPTKQPAQVTIDTVRADYWIGRGAQMSPTVKRLLTQTKKKSA